jgi:hypothetical protein
MQMDPVVRSRRKALREAQTWLLERAREMNHEGARQVLNSAAFSFGAEKLRGFNPKTGRSELQERAAAKLRRPADPTPGAPSADTGPAD